MLCNIGSKPGEAAIQCQLSFRIQTIQSVSLPWRPSRNYFSISCLSIISEGHGHLLSRLPSNWMGIDFGKVECSFSPSLSFSPWFDLSSDCTLVLVCTNCEAKNRAYLAVGLHQGSCQIIRFRYGCRSLRTCSYSGMASKYIRLPDSFPLQRGIQQALAYPTNYCWETEAQVIIWVNELCLVHNV